MSCHWIPIRAARWWWKCDGHVQSSMRTHRRTSSNWSGSNEAFVIGASIRYCGIRPPANTSKCFSTNPSVLIWHSTAIRWWIWNVNEKSTWNIQSRHGHPSTALKYIGKRASSCRILSFKVIVSNDMSRLLAHFAGNSHNWTMQIRQSCASHLFRNPNAIIL